TPYVKDAFHHYLVAQDKAAVNPKGVGSKAALHYFFPKIPPKGSIKLLLRLTDQKMEDPLKDVEAVIQARKQDADCFYEQLHPKKATEDEKAVQRQALAGMIWNKQVYIYDVSAWLEGDNPNQPPPASRKQL